MTISQEASIVAIAVIVVMSLSQRRWLFSWSAIGVFWVTHVVFICIGLLVIPWVASELGRGVFWEGLNFSLLSESDWRKAIALVVGWIVLVVIFYQAWAFMFGKKFVISARRTVIRYSNPYLQSAFHRRRLIYLSFIALVSAGIYLVLNLDVFANGVVRGFIGGDPEAVYLARRASTQNYLFVQLVYNVIPFCAVALWVQYYFTSKIGVRYCTIAYVLAAAALLILVFQKRPLLIFVFALGLSHLWVTRDLLVSRFGSLSFSPSRLITVSKGIAWAGAAFGILVVLYLMQTQIGRDAGSYVDAIQELSVVAAVRVFGRMAIQPAMVVHYFPGVESFYGISNVGLITSVLGLEHFSANSKVFEYFRGYSGGNIAMPALLDFYAAFGVPGWFLSSVGIALLLNRLDSFLKNLRRTRARIVITIFAFVFVYYLSQASIFRALLGYGGIVFLLLWVFLVIKFGFGRVRISGPSRR